MNTKQLSLAVLAALAVAAIAPAAPADKTEHGRSHYRRHDGRKRSPASTEHAPTRGQLGVAVYGTSMHTRPSSSSPICASVPAEMRLVVLPGDIRGWKAVLLTTGSLAYVISDAVQVYPQEYEIKPLAASRTGMPLASRGGSRRSAAANGSIEEQVASHSQDFLGTPYRWGGNDLVNGIDCSGLVKKLYGEVGVSLPRTAAEQSMVGEPITRLENLRAGDRLYFWDGRKGKVGHTGIYVGGGYFVHASNGHHQVVREPLGQAKWLRILVGARR